MGLNVSLPEGGCDEESSSPLSSTKRGTTAFNYGGWYWLTHYDPDYVRPSGKSGTYTIPYSFQSTYPYSKTKIRDALAALSAATDYAVTFVRRTNEVPYIRVVDDGGCWSYIGMTYGTYQKLSLSSGCVYEDIIQHEFMHAIGFWHEQSRPDRDAHVFIHPQNIISGYENQFETASMINSMGSSYDIASIMHYGATAFSKNGGPTITRRVAGCSPAKIGKTSYSSIPSFCKYDQDSVLTASDATQIEYMYGCDPTATRPCDVGTVSSTTTTTTTTTRSLCRTSKTACLRVINRQVKKRMRACLNKGKTKKRCKKEKNGYKNKKCGNSQKRKKTCP